MKNNLLIIGFLVFLGFTSCTSKAYLILYNLSDKDLNVRYAIPNSLDNSDILVPSMEGIVVGEANLKGKVHDLSMNLFYNNIEVFKEDSLVFYVDSGDTVLIKKSSFPYYIMENYSKIKQSTESISIKRNGIPYVSKGKISSYIIIE